MRFWLGSSFADTAEYLPLARAADRLGYDTVTVSDHVFYAEYEAAYPYSKTGKPPYRAETHWPDVWVTIGAMAAVTERVRFAPNVYIPVARDFFTVAKAVSTASVLSGGRVTLGAGVGWCKDEFLQTGQDFHTRGRRLDEMIPALREVWRGEDVEHHGEFFDFGPLRIAPAPAAPVPVYIGGDSDHALRRAARIGDGWIGNRVYSEEALEALLVKLEGLLAAHGRSLDGFDVVAPIAAMPSAELYRKWRDRGVSSTLAAPWWTATPREKEKYGTGVELKIATMERFADEVIHRI
ncbi:TIGR03619 family F420-dependent LLM class oxidoreductase [Actinocorallia sp. API 0066]|uniref:TIGR03619 family F420-dependent LLM class oxidoreductase n=1 Tax=Actinocorallia sp. API 0066 TaxID=2896846 RepID=UPI001E4739F5|nr:TIGR03619 family F420-dependent LLM class oxidoreductase [Actinocorallia sp. API 0066]MCD0448480.1 TIGR03619 family F420-dependent LLM class oxidoreductase [Actinocorallia sp. API 0066]